MVELLVVISIISLLSSVVLSSLNTAREKARDAKRKSDLHQIQLALALYYDAYGTYPPPKPLSACGNIIDPDWASSGGNCGGQWLTTDPNFYQFLPSVPVDPVNIGSNAGWSDGNNVYSYFPAGSNDYNLVTQLENQNDPMRCAIKPALYHAVPPPDVSWCSAAMGTPRSGNIYADH